jgi:hypothetical protein
MPRCIGGFVFAISLLGALTTPATVISAQTGAQDSIKMAYLVLASGAAAARGLIVMRAIAKDHADDMGFADTTQANAAALGTPMVVYDVRLDSLRNFPPNGDPARLLSGGTQVLYPVDLAGVTRSSITVDLPDSTWRPAVYGRKSFAAAIFAARGVAATNSGESPTAYFLVRVPAFGFSFLGLRRGAVFTVIPLTSYQALWSAGDLLVAQDAFAKLAVRAKGMGNLPM